jgi:preprotein translocase subunit SecD
MGSSSPVVYNPPPPPPPSTQSVSTQSLQNQTALMETSGQQQQMNMKLGAELDRANSEFFTGQNIRQTQATGAETRGTLQTSGEQERLTAGETGKQTRLTQQQAQDYDKYKSQRDYEWSQKAYKA